MIRVLIVDDEKLERVLIRKGFSWEDHGFHIIGEASSGEEALRIIELEKPDVILTDISMAGMDGLTLSEKIRIIHPAAKIVIITGYREFEYARKAVQLGVEDFLLKPVSMEDLSKISTKIKADILEEIEKERSIERLKESTLAEQAIILESLLQRVVEDESLQDAAKEKLRASGLYNLTEAHTVWNMRIREQSGEIDENRIHTVRELLGIGLDEYMVFQHSAQNLVVIHKTTSMEGSMEKARKIHESLNLGLKLYATIGISHVHHGVDELSQAFREAQKALSASVLLGRNRVITYPEYESILLRNEEKRDIDWDDFIFSVENHLEEKVMKYIDQYSDIITSSNITDIEYYRMMTMDLISKASSPLYAIGLDLEALYGEDEFYKNIRSIHTVGEMNDFLKESISKIMALHKGRKSKRGRKVVQDALDCISEDLYSPELSLGFVAQKIFANESYLSRVFKKEVGQSFIEYVLKKRIEESIRLLNTTDDKVYEIAEKVGFKDSHYFSLCFKKVTGVTVKEYRRGREDV